MKKKPSIIKRMTFLLILSIFLPIVLISIYFFSGPVKQIEERQLQKYEERLDANRAQIDAHFNYINDAIALLEDSQSLRESMKKLFVERPQNIEPTDLYYATGLPIAYQNRFSNYAINTIALFSNNKLAYYSQQNTATDQALVRCQNIKFLNSKATRNGKFVFPTETNGYVYYIRSFTDIYNGKSYGEIIVEIPVIPTYTLADQLSLPKAYDYQVDLSQYPSSQYYVYNNYNAIVFSSDSSAVGNTLQHILPSQIISDNGKITENKDYEVFTKYIYRSGLTLAIVTPKREIYNDLNTTKQFFLIFAVIIMGVAIVLSVLANHFLLTPLKAGEKYCDAYQKYPSLPPTYDAKYRELEGPKQIIAQNLKKIDEMRDTIMKNHIKMKDNEIQLLQSQINPHFLFNMLDVIGWQAAQDNSQASEMIDYLGTLLRSNILLNNKEKITIRQEITYINNYLKLQQIRFENKFRYELNIDEEMLDTYYIPKLCLQPIVENCIVHGFNNVSRMGIIDLKIWEDMDDIICTISDNGVGFNAEGFFEREHSPSVETNSKRSNIALYNIQNRIKMMCGAKYGIRIKSVIGQGTQVTVILPRDIEKENPIGDRGL